MLKLGWQKTFLIGSVILASAIFFASLTPATSQSRGSSYMVAGNGDSLFVWRVNVATGAVSYCVRRDNSTDPRFIAERPPYCSAESPPVH
jgi:hypothetical protein